LGGTKLKKATEIKTFIDKYVRVTNRAGFLTHLATLTGADAVTGTNDDEKLNNFLKRDPEKVIKTIIDHLFETPDEKKRIEDLFKKERNSDGKGLDMSKYDSESTQEAPTEKALKLFAYEEILGKTYSYQPADEEHNGGDNTGKGFFDTYIRPYGYAGFWGPLLIIGILVAIF